MADNTLTAHEQTVLQSLASQPDEASSQRAKAILHWAGDPDLDRVAAASGLRPTQARYWIRAFSQSRLGIFPPVVLQLAGHEMTNGDGSTVDSVVTTLVVAKATEVATTKKPRRRKRFGFRASDPMSEAGRRIMAFHFARLRKLESAAAEGDEEAIHDMRVAIRRIRAALRIAGPQYKRKVVRSFRADLRDLADRLGAARDLDVILNHGLAFAGRQAPDAPKLDAWLDHLKSRRASAQQALVQYLAGRRYAKLAQAFEAFVSEPGAAVNIDTPARVCDVIPAAIWAQYGIVRAHEAIERPSLESLHALRIEFKRLRYLLEFFREILGAGADGLIKLTVRAQDHLGLLHDADVTASLLRLFVAEHALLAASDLAAVAAYLSEVQDEIQARQEQFLEIFREIADKSFRRQLARLLSRL